MATLAVVVLVHLKARKVLAHWCGTVACIRRNKQRTLVVQRKGSALRRRHLERGKGRWASKRHGEVEPRVCGEYEDSSDLTMRGDKARSGGDAPGVVLDTGAANVRVGVYRRGSDIDVRALPNAIARTRPGVRRQVLVGDQIEHECLDYGGLQLRVPIDRGMIVDWAAQKAVWDRALLQALGSSESFGALRGHTVVVTEPYFTLPEQQRAFDALMFDWYEADAVWRATRMFRAPPH